MSLLDLPWENPEWRKSQDQKMRIAVDDLWAKMRAAKIALAKSSKRVRHYEPYWDEEPRGFNSEIYNEVTGRMTGGIEDWEYAE